MSIVFHYLTELETIRLQEKGKGKKIFGLVGGIYGDPEPSKSQIGFMNEGVKNGVFYEPNVEVVALECHTVVVIALTEIKRGDEIFWCYGEKYWDTIKPLGMDEIKRKRNELQFFL